MNGTVAMVYMSFFGAVAAIGVTVALVGQPFLSLMVIISGLLFAPNYHEAPKLSERALTDAEAKSQMVNRLTEHLESDAHQEECDEECPVPAILEKITVQ